MSIRQCPHCKKKLWEPIEIIPVSSAILCGNCNCVSKAQNGHCRGCGSGSVVNLERLLQREIEGHKDSGACRSL